MKPTAARLRAFLPAGIALLAAFLFLLAALIGRERADQLDDAHRQAQDAARAGERLLSGTLGRVDLALRELAAAPATSLDSDARATRELQARLERLALPVALALYDEAGALRASAAVPPLVSASNLTAVTTEAPTMAAMAAPAPTAPSLQVDGPVADAGGRPALRLSIEVDRPGASARNVLTATVPLSLFENDLAASASARGSAMLLLRPDSTIIARVPAWIGATGRQILPGHATDPVFRPLDNHGEQDSPLDGRRKFFAYRRLPAYPLVVAAVLDRETVLAAWTRTAWVAGLSGAFAAGATITLLVLLRQRILRADDVAGKLQDDKTRLTAAVEARTQELQRATACAEAANAAKGRFLAAVSHDLRAPLNGILGMTQLLAATELEPRQRRYARSLDTAGKAMLALLNDLLDLARVEAGRLVLERRPFSPWWLIDDLVTLYAPEATAKGLRFTCALDPRLPRVVASDALRLRQILTNLLSNAIKFTERGQVTLRARLMPTGNGVVRFEVSDTGIGVGGDAVTQARLFEPFSQADASVARRFGGTGLGLSICRQLVELFGGRLGVDGRPGVGSTFWFEIALEATPSAGWEGAHEVAALAERGVLLVTSADERSDAIRRWLGAARVDVWEVATAASLHDALSESVAVPYDAVVVLDGPHVDSQVVREELRLGRHRVRGGVVWIGSAADDGSMGPSTPALDIARTDFYAALAAAIEGSPATRAALDDRPDDTAGAFATPLTRVLLAEDNLVSATVTVSLLHMSGYAVDHAADCTRAIEAARHVRYDAFLLDVELPTPGNAQPLALLRGDAAVVARNGITPAIALADADTPALRAHIADAGFVQLLVKPFLPEDLERALARLRLAATARPQSQ